MGLFIKRAMENTVFIRTRKSITEDTIAEHLGISTQDYIMYERGRVSPPLYILESIADFLGVTLNDLFGFKTDISNLL